MSLNQRHIKQSNTIYEVSYVTIQKSTNAAVISAETMETNAEKENIRQASANVYAQPRMAENTETKGQKKTSGADEIVESKKIGNATKTIRERYLTN